MFGKKETPEFEMFVIFDNKVGSYKDPVLAMNRFDILRQLDNLMVDPNQRTNQLVTNSEDFQLFKVAEYSKRTGVITPVSHEHVANIWDVRTAAKARQASQEGQSGH